MTDLHPSGSRSDGAAPTDGERLPAAARREQLLAVGRQVFASKGFHDTAMTDMARAAGVTKPVLYQHFDSKRDLYGAILTDVSDHLTEAVFTAAMAGEGPRGQVSSGVHAAVEFVAQNPYGFQVLLAAGSSNDEEWQRIAHGWRNSMADQIAELIVVEGMSRSQQLALAYGVVGMVESMASYWLAADTPELDANQLADDLTALAWGGLRGQS